MSWSRIKIVAGLAVCVWGVSDFERPGFSSETSTYQTEDKREKLEERYQKLYRSLRTDLEQLASKCDELKKPLLARFTREWAPARDPSREYFSALPNSHSIDFPSVVDRTDKYWLGYFNDRRKRYGDDLFALAKEGSDQGCPDFAYRLLHESLSQDPVGSRSAEVLGFVDEESKIRSSFYKKKEPLLPGGKVVKYESDHFQLLTNVEEKVARTAIRKFECWHSIWRQQFFDYWAYPTYVSRRFKEGGKPTRRSKKFRVILYRGREEYLKQLTPISPGIEVSVGYYLFSQKTSFFYVGQSSNDSTWIHELTHQLMHESIPVSRKQQNGSSLWAVEGIAMYMESICDFGSVFSLGGEDAERLHYCRHNFFRRGFMVELAELNRMTQKEFIGNSDVKALYSLSAGYCHFLMKTPSIRQSFLKFLQLVHQGKKSGVFFDRLLGQVSVDEGFKTFLRPEKSKILPALIRPDGYQILYLGGRDIDDQVLKQIQNSHQLESLDLSGTSVTDLGIAAIGGLKKLQYLSLERTGVTDEALKTVGRLGTLQELDLTTTAVTDDGILQLEPLSELVALWLGGTQLGDPAVESLAKMTSLRQVDLRKTNISANAKKRLNGRVKLID